MKRIDPYQERKKRFKQWYHWRGYGSVGNICPRRVTGRHCLRYNNYFEQPCICTTGGSHLFDHCALWKDETGDIIFTTEPYTMCSVEDLVKFQIELVRLGLEAEILPRSGWNPGSTILIAVHEKDHQIKIHA